MSKSKKPRTPVLVAERAKPRAKFTPAEPDNKLVILFSRVDVDSDWCLTKISTGDHKSLLKKIKDFETMTVNEAFVQAQEPGKDYPLSSLIGGALRRLEDLQLDDQPEISRLRVGGKQRLYGFREENRFYVIWWDPEHEVCPSHLRNT
jgi:hypothetical protein